MNKPTVKLTEGNGNAFAIIAACKVAARKAGWDRSKIDAMVTDMMSKDYDHVLQVAMREFEVE